MARAVRPRFRRLNHLDVIVGKTDGAESASVETITSQTNGLLRSAPQQRRQQDGNADQHAAHSRRARFLLMILGAVLANVLADLKLAQFLDDERSDEKRDQQRRETGEGSAKRQIPEDAEGSEVGKKLLV